MYVVDAPSPLSVNAVALGVEKNVVLVEFEKPPKERLPRDRSTSYPVIAEPPLFVGAVQARLICDDEAVLAVRPDGESGTV